ncbi:MAG: hypothetical protein V3R27_01050 [Pseudomonadales bacterium]|jgi:hypothetical protein
MSSLLVVIAVAVIVTIWVRGARRNRLEWLRKLDLPGRWQSEGEAGTLELQGDLSEGRYKVRDGAYADQGRWVLEGHDLMLTSDQHEGSHRYDLRLFAQGKIGLDGPKLQRKVYVRLADNVVPLRRMT